MLKFEHIEVLGWEAAIRGMRNPMNSWAKSDSFVCDCNCASCHAHGDIQTDRTPCLAFANKGDFVVGPNDLDLMTRLRNAGTDHRKFMRMITVYVDITGPLYWWKEFDTYKVGTVANSCSTMHKIAAKEFTFDDFSREHLIGSDPDISINFEDRFSIVDGFDEAGDLEVVADQIIEYTILALNFYRKKYLETKDKKYWWQMIQLLPSSYNQRRTVMLNYEVLANIYKSRRNHKLDEWRVDFMNWIRTLPYNELIFGESVTKESYEKGQAIAKGLMEGIDWKKANPALMRGQRANISGIDSGGICISLDTKEISEDAKKLIDKVLTEDMGLGFMKE